MRPILIPIAAACALALASGTSCQKPVAGLVLDADGTPAAAARCVLIPERDGPIDLPATGQPSHLETASDAHGRFRITGGMSGTLWVTHGNGGALLARVSPGAPRRVDLREMATVRVAGEADGPATTIDVQSQPDGTGPSYLGRWRGAVELPAGSYRLLLAAGTDRATSTLVHLRAGVTREVAAAATARRLWLPAGTPVEVKIDGWPTVMPARAGQVWLPAATTSVHLRWRKDDSATFGVDQLWLDPGVEMRWAVPERKWFQVAIASPNGEPLAGASVWGTATTARGLAVLSASMTDASGAAQAALPPTGGGVWIHRRGFAHHWLPRERALEGSVVTLSPGFCVKIGVRAAGGREVPGAPVTLVAQHQPKLRWRGITDDRGHAMFVDVPAGQARLSLESPQHRISQRDIVAGDAASGHVWTLWATDGIALLGRVTSAGGAPAADVMVTVRDTTGRLAMPPRRTRTQRDGSFCFTGLDLDELYTLSASRVLGADTWSAQFRGAQPGDTVWHLELRREDPPPPYRRQFDR